MCVHVAKKRLAHFDVLCVTTAENEHYMNGNSFRYDCVCPFHCLCSLFRSMPHNAASNVVNDYKTVQIQFERKSKPFGWCACRKMFRLFECIGAGAAWIEDAIKLVGLHTQRKSQQDCIRCKVCVQQFAVCHCWASVETRQIAKIVGVWQRTRRRWQRRKAPENYFTSLHSVLFVHFLYTITAYV